MFLGIVDWTEMLQENIDKLMMLNKRRKMIPLITSEIALCQYVYDLVLSVNICDLDFCVHYWTSSFDNHFDDSFVVFKNVHLNFELREFCASDNVIHIRQFIKFSVTAYFQFGVGISRTGTSSAYKA